MARVHTHYDNLKVARNAPPEVIRAAYRTLSKKYHPDHNPNNPEAIRIIQLINAAYDVLSDPVRREEHDRWIANAEAQGFLHETGYEKPPETPVRTRRNMSAGTQRPRRKSSRNSGLLHKLQMMFSQFSRYLSKKA
jgi:curved DNA-binding protein CbpA